MITLYIYIKWKNIEPKKEIELFCPNPYTRSRGDERMVDAEIAKVLDIEKWQHLQDSLAKVTNLALIMVDFRGQPLTVHSENRNFCQMVRHHPELSKYCEKCDARGSIEAVRTNQPFIYRCHFDIVDISIPIMFNNHLVGALMAGQVKLATGHGN